ncbi:hypothetical protein V8C86DRAFT_2585754 [Haematococcus lacustris]
MSCVDVAICGGGLGGLAVALGLRHRGIDAHVYEAAPELRTATSTVIGLGSNAFTALEACDPRILPALLPKGVKVAKLERSIRLSASAAPEVTALPATLASYIFRWAAVQNVLASLLPLEAVHCGQRVTGFTDTREQAGQLGRITLHFKGGCDVQARLVVAADGLRSALRAAMLPQDPGPRYLGHMNWNALLYNPEGSKVAAHGPGEVRTCLDAAPAADTPWTLMTMLIDAGGGYTFWQARYLSPTPAFTSPPTQANSSSSAAPHPAGEGAGTGGISPAGGSVEAGGAEAVGGGEVRGSGGPATDQASSAPLPGEREDMPQLVGGGLGVPGSKARVLKLLEEAGYEDVARVVQATPEADIFERAMLDRIPLDELGAGLTAAGGRLLLLGDAAHAMHSGPGQGGRMAFEDAHQLVEAVQRHSHRLHGWSHLAADGSAPPPPGPSPSAADEDTPLPTLRDLSLAAAAAASVEQGSEAGGNQPGSISGEGDGGAAGGDAAATDAVAVADVAREYEAARLVRVCRVAKAAAEGCGLQALRAHYRPASCGAQQRMARAMEMGKWLDKYPDCPDGDEATEWWKPPARPSAVGSSSA